MLQIPKMNNSDIEMVKAICECAAIHEDVLAELEDGDEMLQDILTHMVEPLLGEEGEMDINVATFLVSRLVSSIALNAPTKVHGLIFISAFLSRVMVDVFGEGGDEVRAELTGRKVLEELNDLLRNGTEGE